MRGKNPMKRSAKPTTAGVPGNPGRVNEQPAATSAAAARAELSAGPPHPLRSASVLTATNRGKPKAAAAKTRQAARDAVAEGPGPASATSPAVAIAAHDNARGNLR